MILRDASVHDVPAIDAPQVLDSIATFEEVPPSLAEMTARFEVARAGEFPCLVAEHADTILGDAYAAG